MEDILQGEELDTKHMIQARKAINFFLPNPLKEGESREKDLDYSEKLKDICTLDLVDFDPQYGTLYFGKH